MVNLKQTNEHTNTEILWKFILMKLANVVSTNQDNYSGFYMEHRRACLIELVT